MPGHVLAFDLGGWSIMMGKGMFVVEGTMRKDLGEGGSASDMVLSCQQHCLMSSH